MSNSFDCYPSITLVDTEAVITTCVANSFAFGSFQYIDLTYYGGSQYTKVTSNQEIIDAFDALGVPIYISDCDIYILDLEFDSPQDVDVLVDPTITLVDSVGASLCSVNVFDFASFAYIDFSFYGGNNKLITSNADIINEFLALGITASITDCDITLVDWADTPKADLVGYANPQVCIVDTNNSIPGFVATTITTFDCVDLTFYGGSNCFLADSYENIRLELERLLNINVTYASGCFDLELYLNPVQDVEAEVFPTFILIDTDESLEPICTLPAGYDYTAFEYIDLSFYGGASNVPVNSDADVIAAFAALNKTITLDSTLDCAATLQDCCASVQDVEVSADPRITLIDTDEGITTCVANSFNYGSFNQIDLTPYGGGLVEVSSDAQVIAAFSALSITAVITNCVIQLVGFTGTAVDVEVCAYPIINLVDTDEGITVCVANSIDYSAFDAVDFSPYGGTIKTIMNEAQLIAELKALTGADISIVNCNIMLKDCSLAANDLEVSLVKLPVCSFAITDPTADCDDPVFDLCFGGWLVDGNGTKYELDNGDELVVIVQGAVSGVVSTAFLIVGQNPTTAAGVHSSLNWYSPMCTSSSTELGCYLESKVLDKTELFTGVACFEFTRNEWARNNGLTSTGPNGEEVFEDIYISFVVNDKSEATLSSNCEGTVQVVTTDLIHSFPAPIKPGTPLIFANTPNSAHSDAGAFVYDQVTFPPTTYTYPYSCDFINSPYDLEDSTGTAMTSPITITSCFWETNGASCFGRLYEAGIWNTGISIGEWVGFTKCIRTETTKNYFVGFAADNAGRLKIDGNTIVELIPNSGDPGEVVAFKRWWIVEVTLTAGCHILEMEGQNYGLNGAFGAEIYDNTLGELQAATSESDLNILFTTKDYIGKQADPLTTNVIGGIFCPDCYDLEFEGCCEAVCVRDPEEILCPAESRTCVSDCDTWDMTFSSPAAGRIDWGVLTNNFAPFTTYEISWYTQYGGTGEVLRFQNGSPAVGGNGPTGSKTSLPPGVYSPVITKIDGGTVEYNCLGYVIVV